MKKLMIVTVIIACLSLCAAVWPQTKETEETIPAPLQVTAVSTLEPTIEDTTSKAEITLPAEEEKVEFPQTEPIEVVPEEKPVPEEVPIIAEVQLAPEPEPEPAPAPISTPVPAPSQTVSNPQQGDMLYVPGFGWLECQGSGEVIHDESIYENGNKIGIMG